MAVNQEVTIAAILGRWCWKASFSQVQNFYRIPAHLKFKCQAAQAYIIY